MISNPRIYSIVILVLIVLGILLFNHFYIKESFDSSSGDSSPLFVLEKPDINVITKIEQTMPMDLCLWLSADPNVKNFRSGFYDRTKIIEWVDKGPSSANLLNFSDNKITTRKNNTITLDGVYFNQNAVNETLYTTRLKKNNILTPDNQIMVEYLFFVFITNGNERSYGDTSGKLYLLGKNGTPMSNNRQIYIDNNKIYYGNGGSSGSWINVDIPSGLLKTTMYLLECCIDGNQNVTIILNGNVLNQSQKLNTTTPMTNDVYIGTGIGNDMSSMDLYVMEVLIYNKNITDLKNNALINFVRSYLNKKYRTSGFQNIEGFSIFSNTENYNISQPIIEGFSFNKITKSVSKSVSNLFDDNKRKVEEAARLIAEQRAREEAARLIAEQRAREEAARLKAIADKAIADKAIADKEIADKAIADEAARLKAIADKAIADEAARLKAAADKAAADKAAADEAARLKAAADEAARLKAIADKAAADEAARIEAARLKAEEEERLRKIAEKLKKDIADAIEFIQTKISQNSKFDDDPRLNSQVQNLNNLIGEVTNHPILPTENKNALIASINNAIKDSIPYTTRQGSEKSKTSGIQGFRNIEPFSVSNNNLWSVNNKTVDVTPLQLYQDITSNVPFNVSKSYNYMLYQNGDYKIILNGNFDFSKGRNAFSTSFSAIYFNKLDSVELHLPYYFAISSYKFTYNTSVPFKYQMSSFSEKTNEWVNFDKNPKDIDYPLYTHKIAEIIPVSPPKIDTYCNKIKMTFITNNSGGGAWINIGIKGTYLYDINKGQLNCYAAQKSDSKDIAELDKYWRINHFTSTPIDNINYNSCSYASYS